MITKEPSPYGNGRIQLFDDGEFFVDCPADHEQQAIAHHLNTRATHFGAIHQRQTDNDPKLVVALHMGRLTAFSIGSPNDYPRGFGGDVWHIYFDDGRYERCCSLWCMGDIPDEWKDRIVKNARFGSGLKVYHER